MVVDDDDGWGDGRKRNELTSVLIAPRVLVNVADLLLYSNTLVDWNKIGGKFQEGAPTKNAYIPPTFAERLCLETSSLALGSVLAQLEALDVDFGRSQWKICVQYLLPQSRRALRFSHVGLFFVKSAILDSSTNPMRNIHRRSSIPQLNDVLKSFSTFHFVRLSRDRFLEVPSTFSNYSRPRLYRFFTFNYQHETCFMARYSSHPRPPEHCGKN